MNLFTACVSETSTELKKFKFGDEIQEANKEILTVKIFFSLLSAKYIITNYLCWE